MSVHFCNIVRGPVSIILIIYEKPIGFGPFRASSLNGQILGLSPVCIVQWYGNLGPRRAGPSWTQGPSFEQTL